MAKYWITTITNPTTGQPFRLIAYAEDGAKANQRMLQWLNTNPFQLGRTDLHGFLNDLQRSGEPLPLTPSDTRPAPQGGDTTLDLPSGASEGSGGLTPGVGGGGGGSKVSGGGLSSGRGANAAAGVGAGNLPGGLEGRFPGSAYQRGLQRQGLNPEGLFADYLDELYAPTAATFNVENVLAGRQPEGLDLENAFQNFVANTPISQIRSRATQAFREIAGGGSVGPRSADATELFASYQDPYGVGATGAPDPQALDELEALAGQAAATKYTPFTARRFLPKGEQVRARFQRGGLQGSFLDELKRAFGLSGGF